MDGIRVTSMFDRAALLVSAAGEDYDLLGKVFSQEGWTLYLAPGFDAAVAFLRENSVPVVVTERDLLSSSWKDLFAATRQLPRAPLFIVAARLADEGLWAEVLNLGGFDVLCKPFRTKEVMWVLNSAWEFTERDALPMGPKGIEAPTEAYSLSACGG